MRHRPKIASMLNCQQGPDLSGAAETVASGPNCDCANGSCWRCRPGSRRCAAVKAASQCESSTGSGGLATMVFVAPPRMKSRMRECP